MIIAVIELIAFLAGCIVLATMLVCLFIKLLDRVLDKLIQHLIPPPISPLDTSNDIDDKRADSKTQINPTNIGIDFHKPINEIHHKLISATSVNNLLKKLLGRFYGHEHRQYKDNTANNKHKSRYAKCFVPIKHIGIIVKRLRA